MPIVGMGVLVGAMAGWLVARALGFHIPMVAALVGATTGTLAPLLLRAFKSAKPGT